MSIDLTNSKRLLLVYITIILWTIFGITKAFVPEVSYEDLSVFFLSLTGFVAVYIWGESVRKSEVTTIFLPGRNSRRERLIYIVIALWAITGAMAFWQKLSFVSLSTYFGALTPFVGAYILGQTYKPSDSPKIENDAPLSESNVPKNENNAPEFKEENMDNAV